MRLELSLRGRVLAWLAALAAAAAWFAGDADARLAAALLAAPLLVDFVAKPRHLAHLRLRVGPRRTPAGVAFVEMLLVQAPGPRALREVLLHEPRTMRAQSAVLLPDLVAAGTTRVAVRQRSLQRGVQAERVFLLATHWPLGLFLARTSVQVAAELVTEPARIPLRTPTLAPQTDADVAPRDRTELAGPEFHSLREHRPDDDARGVHARRSAALGVLVQRIAHGRTPRTVGLVVDLRRPPGSALDRGTRAFEWGMSAAATLLQRLQHQGAVAQLLLLGDTTTGVLVQGPARENEAMTRLAAATPAAFRPLVAGELASASSLTVCYWIVAGSHDDAAERAVPGFAPIVLRGDA
ncbi:MAG: DUF58 domain-containing protein [Planctomycetes bacterium]|nr:DUF58 domain-containing protein [Planctomycetota bacterium]